MAAVRRCFRSLSALLAAAVVSACLSPARAPESAPPGAAPTAAAATSAVKPTATEGWFPFTLDGLDAAPSFVDVSFLNGDGAAGERGFVRSRGGHLVDGAGQPVRFFGVNLTATACFPEKSDAPKIARHLKKLGVNVVRFHFMDVGPAPNGLFESDGKSLDAAQLDRLDFLIAELKSQGIYTNLNLHVARRYPGLEGAAAARFQFGKLLDRFYDPFIELQKEYARQLLTHVNPYTKNPYVNEPALLCVELNNENTLLPFWGGSTDALPEPYAAALSAKWQRWLKQRYGVTAKLAEAWKAGSLGTELLVQPDAAEQRHGWHVEDSVPGLAKLEVAAEKGPILRWTASSAGSEPWHLQILQAGLPLVEGKSYVLRFRARALAPAAHVLEVSAMLDQPDWRSVGLWKALELTAEWQAFALGFRAENVVQGHGRINFSLKNVPGTLELADVSLREGGATLDPAHSIEAGNVGLPGQAASGQMLIDYQRFLAETELAASRSLADYLRQTLRLKSLLTDTQASYGGVYGVLREAALSDYVDMHGYWQHPAFPAGWSETSWSIRNESQIRDRNGGTLASIGAYRVAGMPFSVSEYNTPSPNDYAAETLPLYATLAAFQDWDAIYLYTYLDFKRDWNADRLLGFFDFAGHPGKLAFAAASALAFRRGLVSTGKQPITLNLPKQQAAPAVGDGALPALWSKAQVPPAAIAARRLQVKLVDGKGPPFASETLDLPARVTSDTNEIVWDAQAARFTVNAPALRVFAGDLRGSEIQLGGVGLELGSGAPEHACAQLVALDEKPIRDSRKLLLIVAARVENQGMGWNAERTTLENRWGNGPTLAEPVPFSLRVPGSGWRAAALDGKGAETSELPMAAAADASVLQIGKPATLWYALSR